MSSFRVLLEKDPRTHIHFIRASLASMSAFAIEFSILFLCTTLMHMNYLVAAFIGFITGTVILYLLSVLWVFHKRKIKDKRFEFSVFVGVSAAALGANAGLLILFTEVFSIHYLVSRLIAALCVFAGNFAIKKILLFK